MSPNVKDVRGGGFVLSQAFTQFNPRFMKNGFPH
jgi:hypothetical protein